MLFESERVEITNRFEPDKEVQLYVNKIAEELDKKLDIDCGYIDADLDCLFSHIRVQPTNLGNFVADLCRTYYKCDVCMINSGTFRLNSIVEPGYI